jgi:SHS2 domain-containing protein
MVKMINFYEVLDSTSELKLRIFGRNRATLFEHALLAMFEIIEPQFLTDAREFRIELSLSAIDTEQLLIDFLSEALFHADSKHLAFFRVDFDVITETSLRACIIGRKVRRFAIEIKAVTHHDVHIVAIDGMLCVAIIFDI